MYILDVQIRWKLARFCFFKVRQMWFDMINSLKDSTLPKWNVAFWKVPKKSPNFFYGGFETLERNLTCSFKRNHTNFFRLIQYDFLIICKSIFDKTAYNFFVIIAYLPTFFVTNVLPKSLWASKSFKNPYQRVQMIDILLKYILWYEFLNDLDALRVILKKKIVTKKLVK